MAGIDLNRTTSGVSLPPQVSSEIWGQVVEDSAVMAAARQITLPGSGISIPMITADAVADWVDETEDKPVSRPTLSNKAMTPYKLAVIVPFSNEFKRDIPGLYAELVRRLPAALGRKFDETVFGMVPAPGPNFDTLATSPSLTVDATNTFSDLVAVVNGLATENADLSHWIAGPALYGLLLGAVNPLGQQIFVPGGASTRTVGNVLGSPVIKTNHTMPSGAGATSDITGIAGDWAGSAVWGSVEGVQVSQSDQATLKDGANTINLWQKNMFAIRAEIEVGFRVKDTDHFRLINDGIAD